MTAIQKTLGETENPFVLMAALCGADILVDSTEKAVHSFNEKARDWVNDTQPKTRNVAEFTQFALDAGFNVWGAIVRETGVEFGPVAGVRKDDEAAPEGATIQ